MFYKFPENITLDEVRDTIDWHNANLGAKAFIIADKGDYVVANYTISLPDSFPMPNTGDAPLDRRYAILRECRGIKFYPDGTVAARPYHKFHNVNEREETQLHVIDWTKPHRMLEKLDGSMLTPFLRKDGNVEWHTKMGATDVAKPVMAFVGENQNYDDFARKCIADGVTPIFEWCSRQQKIVVDYPEDRLVLTAARVNITGEYIDYPLLKRLGDNYGVDVVNALEGFDDIERFIKHTRELIEYEGYVVRFDSGAMTKVKADAYILRHKSKELCESEKDVLGVIFKEQVDDLLPLLSDEDRQAVNRFDADLMQSVSATANRLSVVVEDARASGIDKKTFALDIAKKAGLESPLLFSMWDGHEPVEVVRNYLLKNVGSSTKVDSVRALFGNLKWSAYRSLGQMDTD